jgi:hypothetical protein
MGWALCRTRRSGTDDADLSLPFDWHLGIEADATVRAFLAEAQTSLCDLRRDAPKRLLIVSQRVVYES